MFPKRACFIRNIISIALILKTFAKVPNPGLKATSPSETRQQSRPCLLLQIQFEEDHVRDGTSIPNGNTPSSWRCQVEGKDVVNAGASQSRKHVLVDIEGIDRVFASNVNIQSGVTTLFVKGAIMEDHKLIIFPENKLIFGTYTSDPQSNIFLNSSVRSFKSNNAFGKTTGTKTVLAVRVKTKDAEPTAGTAEIGDKFFGTSGDIVNLKSQVEGCSYGKMKIEMARARGNGCNNDPTYTYFRVFGDGGLADCAYFQERDNSTDYCQMFGDELDAGGRTANSACCICGGGDDQEFYNNEIVDGVIEIQLDLTIAESDCFSLEEEAVHVLESKFDGNELFTMFDHVMLCLPPGTQRHGATSWRAYAYINHYLQVYHDDWCGYPKTQVHEMSHNLGLAHSWISFQSGYEETVMGSGFRVDEGPLRARVCFNPSKSYQLGWYDDKNIQVYPETNSWRGKIVGVGNYGPTREDAAVVLKVAGDPGTEDYYIGFNHAVGFHVGTSFGVNKVKIVRQGTGFAESWIEALLGDGESYVINNYLGSDDHVVIRVTEIDKSANGFAFLKIFTFHNDDPCDDLADFVLDSSRISSCEYFADNEQVGCPLEGLKVGDCSGSRCTAREACCHCGGGIRVTPSPTSFPTTAPSTFPTTANLLQPQEKKRSAGQKFIIAMCWITGTAMVALLVRFAATIGSRR
jgi:hypothetical protein